MKWKIKSESPDNNEIRCDDFEWKRIFRVLPIITRDGYTVMFGYVWRRKNDVWLGNDYIYAINPDQLEDTFQSKKLALSEGRMLHGNPPPPLSCNRPKPPPPPPPPRRVDGGTFAVDRVLKSWGLGFNPNDVAPPIEDDKVCPKCYTSKCSNGDRFTVSGAGVLQTTSKDITESCNSGRQLRSLERINIKRKPKKTTGTGPR